MVLLTFTTFSLTETEDVLIISDYCYYDLKCYYLSLYLLEFINIESHILGLLYLMTFKIHI